MKRMRVMGLNVKGMGLIPLMCALALLMAGCSGTGCAGKGRLDTKTGVYDANADADPFVVGAEDTRKIATEVFDGFLAFERQNEEALKKLSPAIHTAAERVRKDGERWLDDVTRLKLAYQGNRSAENRANLTTALETLKMGMTVVQGYMAASLK